MSSLTLTNVRPLGGPTSDIVIDNGLIIEVRPYTSITPQAPPSEGRPTLDGRNLLAIPGLINTHAHVDKSWWGKPWVSYGGEPTTQGRIAHERAHRDELNIPSVGTTTEVLKQFLRKGTTAVRTHIDVDLGIGLTGIAAAKEAARSLDDAITLEIVAFPQDGVLRRPGVLDLLDQAAREGAGHLGGLDPAGIDRDPVAQIDALFTLAEKHNVGLDIHLHDSADLGAFQIELIADRTIRTGLQGKVNLSHGFALSQLSPARQLSLLDAIAPAQLSWTTVAPLGIPPLPLKAMAERDIAVGLGTDGIRDLWSPYGDGDMLTIALTFARLHGLRTDDDLANAISLVTSGAAGFVSRENHSLTPGSRADIVLLDAENVQDVLVRTPERELVLSAGRVVHQK